MGSIVQYLERDPFERLSNPATIHANADAAIAKTESKDTEPNRVLTGVDQNRPSTPARPNSRKSGRPSSAPPGSCCIKLVNDH